MGGVIQNDSLFGLAAAGEGAVAPHPHRVLMPHTHPPQLSSGQVQKRNIRKIIMSLLRHNGDVRILQHGQR